MAPPFGSIPWNKGKRGLLSAEVKQRLSDARKRRVTKDSTRLKLAEVRRQRNKASACSAGTVRIRKSKNTRRAFVKVVDHPAFGTRWVKRANFNYWKRLGITVPKGMLLHHKDEDSLNDRFENLVLLTGSEHSKHHRNFGDEPWNKNKRGLQKRPDLAALNKRRAKSKLA